MSKQNTNPSDRHTERVKELFKVLTPDELYDTWADKFNIYETDSNHVTVVYHGEESIKSFKKDCKKMLRFCIQSAFGKKKKMKITRKIRQNIFTPGFLKNIRVAKFLLISMIFACIAVASSIVLYEYIANRDFREVFYTASSIKVDGSVRVIQISDLHCAQYGQDNESLLERIEALQPDIIICTGDIVNSAQEDVDYAVSLAQGLSKIAPAYYIYGNNEVETIYNMPLNEKALDEKFGFDSGNRDETALLRLPDAFEEKLESAGMKVLKNEKDTVTVRSMDIDVYGVLTSNPSSFWSYSEKAFAGYLYEDPDHLKITVVHEPFLFETFQPEFWGDLMLCGHTHGGVMRVPVLGPLYTREGGLFPERSGSFVYGRYHTAGKLLIVSSGLDNSSVFRINNEPELVIIDINKF